MLTRVHYVTAAVLVIILNGSCYGQGFFPTGSMNQARADHSATLLTNGLVLVAGGATPQGPSARTNSAEVFDPNSGTWRYTKGGPLTIAREAHTATLLPNGKVLIAGGLDSSGTPTASAELFDPATETFTATSPMSYARAGHFAFLQSNGTVLVVSGPSGRSIEVYDPTTKAWAAKAPVPGSFSGIMAAQLSDGRIWVAENDDYGSAVFVYSPAFDVWLPSTPLITEANGSRCVALPSAKVWKFGGTTFLAWWIQAAPIGYTEIYDVSALPQGETVLGPGAGYGTSASGGSNIGVATLLDGRVLITGGAYGAGTNEAPGAHSGATLFDPTSSTTTGLPNMTVARYMHTATTLSNGQVLIAGGYDSSIYVPDVTATAELWGNSQTGTINVTTNVSTATYTITGPASYSGSGTSFTQSAVPTGTYTITYGDVVGYITPSTQTQDLAAGGTIVFTGTYVPLLSVSPTTLLFSYPPGSSGPITPQFISVSAGSPLPYLATSSADWLLVDSFTGVTPGTVSVTVSPGLAIGAYTGQITITAVGAANSPQIVFVSLTVAAGQSPRLIGETNVSLGHADEPVLAIDPRNTRHVVVGYNDLSSRSVCAWAETTDGGQSWSRGHVSLAVPYSGTGDPWLRFAPDGSLYYSCMGATDYAGTPPTRNVGVFIARSRSGLAGQFGISRPIVTKTQVCIIDLLSACLAAEAGPFSDHPSFAVLTQSRAQPRLIATWVDVFTSTQYSTVLVSYSDDDGYTWSTPTMLASGSAETAFIGGNRTTAGVTWYDFVSGTIYIATTNDGQHWNTLQAMDTTDGFVSAVGSSESASTTTAVYSTPYAYVVPGPTVGSLNAIWTVRKAGRSSTLWASSVDSWVPQSIGSSLTDAFLPGGGTCSNVFGLYKTIDPTTDLFEFTAWSVGTGAPEMIFRSSVPNDGKYGDPDDRGRRIGDYTAVDCSGKMVWAAWTDVRDKYPEVFVAQSSIP